MSNEFSKFKRGDRVLTPFNSAGTVISTFRDPDNKRMMVKVMSELSDYEQTWHEDELKFNYTDLKNAPRKVDLKKYPKCPKCNTEWTVTKFGSNTWYDCSTCKKKAEILIPFTQDKAEEDENTWWKGWASSRDDDDDLPF